MTRFATRLTLAFAVLALTLTAGHAHAAPASNAVQGDWITPVTDKDGNAGFTVIRLADDGSAVVINCDADGKPTGSVDGTYSYEDGVLAVTVGSKRISEQVVSVDGQEMVTVNGQGLRTEWHRAKLVRD